MLSPAWFGLSRVTLFKGEIELQVVEKSLAEVRLTEALKVRAGSYSGGMKRRLSVAIALIGDPKLVILDEPVKHPHLTKYQNRLILP